MGTPPLLQLRFHMPALQITAGARGRVEPLKGSVPVGKGVGRAQLTVPVGQTVSLWWGRVDSLRAQWQGDA